MMDVSFAFLVLLVLVFLSINLNIVLFLRLKKAKKSPQPTLDAQRLLHDMTNGSALLRISVIDPTDMMIRSPRG